MSKSNNVANNQMKNIMSSLTASDDTNESNDDVDDLNDIPNVGGDVESTDAASILNEGDSSSDDSDSDSSSADAPSSESSSSSATSEAGSSSASSASTASDFDSTSSANSSNSSVTDDDFDPTPEEESNYAEHSKKSPVDMSGLDHPENDWDKALAAHRQVLNKLSDLYKSGADITADDFKDLIEQLDDAFQAMYQGNIKANKQVRDETDELSRRLNKYQTSTSEVDLARKWINEGMFSTIQRSCKLIASITRNPIFSQFVHKYGKKDIPQVTKQLQKNQKDAQTLVKAHEQANDSSSSKKSNDSKK